MCSVFLYPLNLTLLVCWSSFDARMDLAVSKPHLSLLTSEILKYYNDLHSMLRAGHAAAPQPPA